MKASDVLASALWAVKSRPFRTGALLLSLAAGVAAAVFVGAVISGFGREIDRLAFGTYARALIVRENVLIQDRYGPPDVGDQARLEAGLDGFESSAAWKSGRAQSYRDGETIEFTVFGVSGDYHHELDTPLAAGRLLTNEETTGFGRACLIGAETAIQLETAGEVGDRLRINGVDCEIVGVLGEPNSRPAARYAEAVIAPFRTTERYFLDGDYLGPGEASWITLIMAPGTDMARTEMRADLLLRKQRGASLSRASPFSYGDASASLDQMTEQRAMLSRLLGTLAALTILTSLIAFAAIGAAAMASRQREIALRLAMGAADSDIHRQVVLEALLVGGAGGAVGLVAGLALGRTAAALWNWPFAPSAAIAATAIGLGLLVGLGVGVMLARRAAALPPSLAARA